MLESDFSKLINHLKKSFVENSGFGNIVEDILLLGRIGANLSYCHAGRDKNKLAHKLSHLSRNFRGMRVWIEEVPNCLQRLFLL